MNSFFHAMRYLILQRLLTTATVLLAASPAAWCAGAGTAPAAVAPAPNKAPAAKAERAVLPTDEEAFAALIKQNQDAKLSPVEVVASYKAFLKANPRLTKPLGIDIYRKIMAQQTQSKDSAAVHQSFYSLVARYREEPEALPLVMEHTRLLLSERRTSEAAQRMQPFLGRFTATPALRYPGILLYAQALEAGAQWPQLSQFVAATVAQQPGLLTESSGALVRMLADSLMRQQRAGEALQWAKLRFVTCDFDNASVTAASTLLSRTWLARDLSLERAQAFTVALQDGTKANPLARVTLPSAFAVSADAIGARVKREKLSPHDHITLLLAAGHNAVAVAEARKLLVDEATSASGVGELCRVLKARSLNVREANAFVQYVKTGTGPNPLSEAPAAPAPLAKPAAKPARPAAMAGALGTQPKPLVTAPAAEQGVRPAQPNSFGLPAKAIS